MSAGEMTRTLDAMIAELKASAGDAEARIAVALDESIKLLQAQAAFRAEGKTLGDRLIDAAHIVKMQVTCPGSTWGSPISMNLSINGGGGGGGYTTLSNMEAGEYDVLVVFTKKPGKSRR